MIIEKEDSKLIFLDLSVNNEIMNFSNIELLRKNILAGISWDFYLDSNSQDALVGALDCVCNRIEDNLVGMQPWLFIGTSTWQTDNRIVRFNGLWKSMKARGIPIPLTDTRHEVMMELNGELKFFGAIPLTGNFRELVISAYLEEAGAYLVYLPNKELGISSIIENGWYGYVPNDLEFILKVKMKNGLVVKLLDRSDTYEKTFIAFGSPDKIKAI